MCAEWVAYIDYNMHKYVQMIIIIIRNVFGGAASTDWWRRAASYKHVAPTKLFMYLLIYNLYRYCSGCGSARSCILPPHSRMRSGVSVWGTEDSRLSLLIKIYFYSFYISFEFFRSPSTFVSHPCDDSNFVAIFFQVGTHMDSGHECCWRSGGKVVWDAQIQFAIRMHGMHTHIDTRRKCRR